MELQKITPCLWFNDNGEEAVKYYTSIFPNSKIKDVAYYGEAGAKASGRPKGSIMTMLFEIEGQEFMALNGGPYFKFTGAISLVVNCENQTEIDRYWDTLSADKDAEQCGWLKDKFGISWQIVPRMVGEIMLENSQKSERVMQALMTMKKIDIAVLKQAAQS